MPWLPDWRSIGDDTPYEKHHTMCGGNFADRRGRRSLHPTRIGVVPLVPIHFQNTEHTKTTAPRRDAPRRFSKVRLRRRTSAFYAEAAGVRCAAPKSPLLVGSVVLDAPFFRSRSMTNERKNSGCHGFPIGGASGTMLPTKSTIPCAVGTLRTAEGVGPYTPTIIGAVPLVPIHFQNTEHTKTTAPRRERRPRRSVFPKSVNDQ